MLLLVCCEDNALDAVVWKVSSARRGRLGTHSGLAHFYRPMLTQSKLTQQLAVITYCTAPQAAHNCKEPH